MADKIDVDVNYHPQRLRPKTRMPNWGHPILRKIKADHAYVTLEEAQQALLDLHQEFPQTTIPANNNKLFLMVFSRKETPKEPVQKYILEIEAQKEGDFIICYEKNTYEDTKNLVKSEENTPQEPPKGYFTARVSLKRRRKT